MFGPRVPPSDGSFVVWRDGGVIRGARISQAGAVLDAPGIGISPASIDLLFSPSVTFDGTSYVVAWGSEEMIASVWAARVTTAGMVQDTVPILIHFEDSGDAEFGNVVAGSDGSSTFVIWQRRDWLFEPTEYSLRARLLSSQGTVSATELVLVPRAAVQPAIAAAAGHVALVWRGEHAWPHRSISGTRLDAQGNRLDTTPVRFSRHKNTQTHPTVAHDGQNYVVAWDDDRNSGDGNLEDIYVTRIDSTGTVLDSGGIQLLNSPKAQVPGIVTSALGHDGTNYVYAWHEQDGDVSRIRAVRVSVDAQVLDADPLLLHEVTGCPHVALGDLPMAFDGAQTVVVWRGCRTATSISRARRWIHWATS